MYTEENNDGIYIERQVRVPGFSMHYEHFHNYMEIFYLKPEAVSTLSIIISII